MTQRDKRIRRPRNVFSPSDNFNRPIHYLLYFHSTDSYNIVLSSIINSINGGTATLYVHGEKTRATIITSGNAENVHLLYRLINCIFVGTFDMCEDEQRKRTRQSQQTSEDEEGKTTFYLTIIKLFHFLEELNANDNEYMNMHSSSQQEVLVGTFSLPNPQSRTTSMNHTPSIIAEESKRIKESHKH